MTADSILDEAFTALIAVPVPITAACALTGRSRATHYRLITPPVARLDPIPHPERTKPPSALSETELGQGAQGDQPAGVPGPVDLSDLGARVG